MEPAEITALVTAASAVITCIATVSTGWLRARVQVNRDREESRRRYARSLPGGSRILDLGDRGLVIEVGRREEGTGGTQRDQPAAARRRAGRQQR
ncbi:hypothetical protein ACFCYF_37615 [Streptomyces chartreusis]|uniref:hypothetical protein n=1 Tax=Streptomyces chartreusis TaxID=1969 RepID=UPI0035E28EC1